MNDFQNINGYENLLCELTDHATLTDAQTYLISPINVILELSIEKRDMKYAIFGAEKSLTVGKGNWETEVKVTKISLAYLRSASDFVN